MTGMFSWEYVLSGDGAAARSAVQHGFEQQGFRIEQQSADEWTVTQGERPSFLERMTTNAHEPIVLTVKFASGADGLVVELHRNPFGRSGMTRNAVQMAALDKGYRAAADALHEHLAAAGILLSSRE
ncbi:hypothetical protein [Herbiconiux sp. YIM B11900]|uniref:hypothetical protein n=1 Tax=Herbiconiux sp. YIM B11900 TaxID=3404131 RepID=UPI003F8615FB